jgi:hypothetical protein
MNTQKKAMLKALKANLGIVSKSCEAVGISRGAHYLWMNNDPEYKEAVEEIDESVIDFAESKLHELIDGPMKEVLTDEGIQQVKDSPVPSAVIFYLKTKGKKRGYIERTEISGADGGPIQIIIPQGV